MSNLIAGSTDFFNQGSLFNPRSSNGLRIKKAIPITQAIRTCVSRTGGPKEFQPTDSASKPVRDHAIHNQTSRKKPKTNNAVNIGKLIHATDDGVGCACNRTS